MDGWSFICSNFNPLCIEKVPLCQCRLQCYTVRGLELSRVTVINSDLQVVYDAFVKPDSEVIDYNTR